ncbi:hypothetical protein IWX78_002248 [Mycetocola sp. CAN_C7]
MFRKKIPDASPTASITDAALHDARAASLAEVQSPSLPYV